MSINYRRKLCNYVAILIIIALNCFDVESDDFCLEGK